MSILLASVLGTVKYMAVVSAFQVYGGLKVRGGTKERAIEVIKEVIKVDLRGISPPSDSAHRVYSFDDWMHWCWTLPIEAVEGSIFDQQDS